ncbi:putative C6 transcription factor [Hypoxylon trugodes]|uniref:putative C6 transcription factor n=1 Tax=Hypoxylon trugodes TaxID=326681 RepID=UPI0021A07743|nr:putative C6 transcription factor [Hypoxylon trugodes]KAI1390395.1 putative C6 transcription factor [Hypoxylon trugodes]
MDRRGPGHSAPYGQACMHCFKSKCKCVSRPDGDGCERCHRLNKQCRPSDSLRKRNAQKNQNSTARIAQLEGRLESLVSLLQSVTKSPDSSDALRKILDESLASDVQPDNEPEPQTTTPISSTSNISKGTSAIDADDGGVTSPLARSHYLRVNGLLNAEPTYELSIEEADKNFRFFRSHMLKDLAFIHIPLDVTSEQLRQTRPFLFQAIVTVASPMAYQKMARGKELKRVLAQSAFVDNRSSLDLLLGVLTYVAWGWDPFLTKSSTLSRLMMLAMSFVGNLRLNKPLPQDVHMIGPLTPGFIKPQKDEVEDPEQRHLERQRAVLGCFILSSIISSYYAQIDPMRWTPQMDEALNAISSNKECPTDNMFAFQVRLQLVAQKAAHVREQQESNYPRTATASLPAFAYVNALQGQLQDIRGKLSSKLEQERTLIAQIHYVNLCINESFHTANSDAPVLTTPTAGGTSGFERLECLWGSVKAIKLWLDSFFAVSPSALRGIAFPFWAQMARCLVVLCRLSTLEDPAWDRKAVRETVDLLAALDRIAERAELASREASEPPGDDLFMQVSRLMKMFRAWAAAKMAPAETGEEPGWTYGDAATNAEGNIMDFDPNQMMQFMDLGADTWWEEFSAGFR